MRSALSVLALAALAAPARAQGGSLRFFGGGVNAPDADRVKIRVDDPATVASGPPVDVGAQDFTLEFWLRGRAQDNTAPPVSCGANVDWIFGNIVLDRDRYNQDRKFGVSLAGGRVVFGVSGAGTGDRTLCSASAVLDDTWRHIALQRRRSDGRMWVFVDGQLEAEADGPDGDVSYPDAGVPGNFCGGACVNSDPFLVLAAEKHDAGAQYPSFNGYLDELRVSNVLRYSTSFAVPSAPFGADLNTVGLYHFDEGLGSVLFDFSAATGGPSDGEVLFGGNPLGPTWSSETPFATWCSSAAFGVGKLTSLGGRPRISSSGSPSVASVNFELRVSDAVPLRSGLFFHGSAPASAPFLGATRYVATPFQRLPVIQLDATGAGVSPFSISAAAAGSQRYFQFWFRDPAQSDGTNAGLSNGLAVWFCP